MKNGFVYILTNKNNSTLYIGVTNNLLKRIYDHETDKGSDFTIKYRLVYLVYYEEFNSI